jgi:RNase P subunit RPR2
MVAKAKGRAMHFGTVCSQCHSTVIAPQRSAYVSKHRVRHVWSCDACGHEFEVSVNLRANDTLKTSNSIRPASLVA